MKAPPKPLPPSNPDDKVVVVKSKRGVKRYVNGKKVK